ncbi:MAG: UPF0182 family protein [Mastigocoleus sp. MO_167.B18]|uniref:UPF0182 family protein n=1 Tax=Mastigocoleus sp. MO_188.B34 TaxID=3036635 RepID=UPI0026244A55|nr:UPF0182 family protein [Mastigocoleus sp. MO_188.B34]MDJ0697275.1 UPF0182 family protein [Mastigocoleus sp. MO_188.B34]MDJ0775467.1 UPF0182 family protein [Mastigocoleus sp. MO_167.B18]
MLSLRWSRRVLILVIVLAFASGFGCYAIAESFWFGQFGYLHVFWLPLFVRGSLWIIVFSLTASLLLGNLFLAQHLKHPCSGISLKITMHQDGEHKVRRSYRSRLPKPLISSGLGIYQLLLLMLGLALSLSIILFHCTRIVISYWHSNPNLNSLFTPLPPQFRLGIIWQVLREISYPPWHLGLLIAFVSILLFYTKFCLSAIAVLLSIDYSIIWSSQWASVLRYLNPTPFNQSDLLFGQDLGFYTFFLPVWELLEFWLVGVSLYALAAVAMTYLLSGDSLSQGHFLGFTSIQLRHLQGLGGFLMLVLALSHWLNRYRLLYSTRGAIYGAGYTDLNLQLPIETRLSFLCLAIALVLGLQAIMGAKAIRFRCRTSWVVASLYFIGVMFGGILLPTLVQRLMVQPNELALEFPYLERNIVSTREAFDLKNIEVKSFNPESTLSYADLQENNSTIRNIRLWDKKTLLATNRQLQQIRPYYRFPDVDFDRYTLKSKTTQTAERKQVIIGARELEVTALPSNARNWINEHLVYTHGYGFTLNLVNAVGAGGLPDYLFKDIGISKISEGNSLLGTTSESIAASLPIGHPRIYYGQITNNYIMAPSKVKELDFPKGNTNIYNTYDGQGGVAVGTWWQRLVFSVYLRDGRILLTRNFTPSTKLLFRRNIIQRLQAIAPFLKYDRDSYLVVADPTLYSANEEAPSLGSPSNKLPEERNYLYWIVDAYTVSDRYPYSEPGIEGFNYIRNSVKVVIDAYNGSVFFYVTDNQDPLIRTWQRIFPKLFHPLDEMPPTLRAHIRYPVDLFAVQSERLLSYHMSDPQVFYNREDQWQIATEIYGSKLKAIDPYYAVMTLPTGKSEKFILLLPFTPIGYNNLTAWLAALSDGNNYGKLLLYEFPKERLIYGPQQIDARINQDPAISRQISLWNREGSQVIQGNLLVIPIKESLLYVEPLYLKAGQKGLPTLARVIVAYKNQIAMAKTLDRALDAIFRPELVKPVSEPTIIRELE